MTKLLNLDKLEFKINWASGTTIVTLLVGVITLYMTNQNLNDKIDGLEKNNQTLTTTVGTLSESVNILKGSQSSITNAMTLFLENPPGELKYRIERVEQKLGIGIQDNTKPFVNKPPGQ